jgi:hypothetical protein
MGYTCSTCGVWHDQRPTCFLSKEPAAVAQIPLNERRKRVELGSDQCVLDNKDFFILGNLDVSITGTDDFLRWTVWTTLSEPNFKRASELWETPGRESEPPYFGWLSSFIPGYESINIKTFVHTQAVGVRPKIEVVEEGHPLAVDQARGITLERADELIHLALHT